MFPNFFGYRKKIQVFSNAARDFMIWPLSTFGRRAEYDDHRMCAFLPTRSWGFWIKMSMDAKEKAQSVKCMHKQIDLHSASQHLHKKHAISVLGDNTLMTLGTCLLSIPTRQWASVSIRDLVSNLWRRKAIEEDSWQQALNTRCMHTAVHMHLCIPQHTRAHEYGRIREILSNRVLVWLIESLALQHWKKRCGTFVWNLQ